MLSRRKTIKQYEYPNGIRAKTTSEMNESMNHY